jgi:hypothetical protein
VSADIAHELQRTVKKRTARATSVRARLVLALGPLSVLAGLGWAVAQPWRLTLLHPHGQGFWWLFSEPPLYVVLVGLLFRLVVAPGLVRDLEAEE